MGVDIDPSFDRPLPIGGLNILDFNFLNRNLQLALLYGGVIAFGNIQHANLWGGRFDASVDFFGLALKANDDRLRCRGGSGAASASIGFPSGPASIWATRLTPFQKLTASLRVQVRRVLPGRRDGVELRDSVEHGHERRGSGVRVPTARLLAAGERRRVSALDVDARGARATASTRATGRMPGTTPGCRRISPSPRSTRFT